MPCWSTRTQSFGCLHPCRAWSASSTHRSTRTGPHPTLSSRPCACNFGLPLRPSTYCCRPSPGGLINPPSLLSLLLSRLLVSSVGTPTLLTCAAGCPTFTIPFSLLGSTYLSNSLRHHLTACGLGLRAVFFFCDSMIAAAGTQRGCPQAQRPRRWSPPITLELRRNGGDGAPVRQEWLQGDSCSQPASTGAGNRI
jgi:hypothetical protein